MPAAMPEDVTVDRERDAGYMQLALDIAHRGAAAGEPPIGACLIQAGQVVARTHNAVIGELDITAHAEIRAIRDACRSLRTLDLTGARLFVTVQPCAMCLAACHYAGVSEIIFGARLSDMNRHTGNELSQSDNKRADARSFEVTPDFMRDDCLILLEEWARRT